MKTKRFYEQPKVGTLDLYAEGVLCASGTPNAEATAGFGWMSGTENDLSGLDWE